MPSVKNKKGKGVKKARRKQRRSILPWIGHIAAAIYWLLKIILLLWDRFSGQ